MLTQKQRNREQCKILWETLKPRATLVHEHHQLPLQRDSIFLSIFCSLLSLMNLTSSHNDTFAVPERFMQTFFWAFTHLILFTCPRSLATPITHPHPTDIPHLVNSYSSFRPGLHLWPLQFARGALLILTVLTWLGMVRPNADRERNWKGFYSFVIQSSLGKTDHALQPHGDALRSVLREAGGELHKSVLWFLWEWTGTGVSRLRTGYFEQLQQAWGHRGCPSLCASCSEEWGHMYSGHRVRAQELRWLGVWPSQLLQKGNGLASSQGLTTRSRQHFLKIY